MDVRQRLHVREDLHGLNENAPTSTPTPRTSTLLQISRVNPIPIVFREIILPDDFFQLAMTLNPFVVPQMRRAYFLQDSSLHSCAINYATFSRLHCKSRRD